MFDHSHLFSKDCSHFSSHTGSNRGCSNSSGLRASYHITFSSPSSFQQILRKFLGELGLCDRMICAMYARVVFPEPVCPTTIVTGYCSMQYNSLSPEKQRALENLRKKHADTHGILQWGDVHVGLEVEESCLMVQMGSHFLVPVSTCPGYSLVLLSQASKTITKTSSFRL